MGRLWVKCKWPAGQMVRLGQFLFLAVALPNVERCQSTEMQEWSRSGTLLVFVVSVKARLTRHLVCSVVSFLLFLDHVIASSQRCVSKTGTIRYSDGNECLDWGNNGFKHLTSTPILGSPDWTF